MIEEGLIESCCCAGNRLDVIDLSEESDTVDLLGGYPYRQYRLKTAG
jgi:hypothetical protein